MSRQDLGINQVQINLNLEPCTGARAARTAQGGQPGRGQVEEGEGGGRDHREPAGPDAEPEHQHLPEAGTQFNTL